VKIRKIDTESAAERHLFTNFPFKLYQNCVNWVPPLSSELNLVLNRRKHPFYKHSLADFFVSESEGQVLGRIAVLHNRNFCNFHQEKTAFVYYFDAVDDQQIATSLFDQAVAWAKQNELDNLLGPKGFLRSNPVGLLADGFEYFPALSMPYNFSYYPGLFESFGFIKESDLLSGYLDMDSSLPPRIHEIAEKIQQRNKFWIKKFKTSAEIRPWVPLVNKVHDEAFLTNPNYYPTTPEEFKLIANDLITIAEPSLIKFIMKEDEVIGFILAYPDISRAIKEVNGKIFPLGWIKLLLEKRRTRLINFNGLGIVPKYQGLGANALLYSELEKTLRGQHFEKAEIIQVDERNFLSKSDMESLHVNWCKRHRIYRLRF
jgi:hypothetical protein